MSYFKQEYLDFFKNLAANNHKKWFDENRKTYEKVVREPFKVFVSDLIDAVHRLDKDITIEPKQAIFRINRDTRFSKDKTPYKLFNSAIISKYGRKDKTFPGMYIELNPERLAIFGGIYMPTTEQTYCIRKYISNNINQFDTIINEEEFCNSYGKIKGLQHKRIPKDFKKAIEKQNLILNKQWYYESILPPNTIIQDNLLEIVLELYSIALPVNQFFIKALQ